MSPTEHSRVNLWACWVPAGRQRPAGPAVWWKALDGSGSLGYAHGLVQAPPWVGLRALTDRPGAQAQAQAQAQALYHYVVETDIPPEAAADFNAWYDQEHLPGLAAVPGTVRARRFRRLSGSPEYLACYDLVSPDVLGSPPWLAVRNTDWSNRVRPLFLNTRRTMHALNTT